MSSLVDLQHIGWLQLTWTLSQAARVSARVLKGMAMSLRESPQREDYLLRLDPDGKGYSGRPGS